MDPLSSVLDDMENDDDFDFDPPECLVPQFTAEDLPNLNANASGKGMDTESTSSASSESKTKYLYPRLDTVEILRPEEIRWFYREPGPNKKWVPFIGYDSLRIECKYRELEGRKIDRSEKYKVPEEEYKFDGEVPLDPEHICVRGSLFQVDVPRRICFPIYWSSTEEAAEVVRGTWFHEYNWQPLDEETADQIELRHLQKFEHHKLPATKTEQLKGIQPVFCKLDLMKGHYVEWNAIDYISLHNLKTSAKINRAVRSKLGMAVQGGNRLQRGYCYEAKMDDKPADISHLVFVVHGIGQKMEQGSIVKSCADLRNAASKLIDKLFVGSEHDKKRVEFLPCEWRSSLKLDGDIVDTITPRKIRGLRSMLNASAMDILYYTSPLYRSEITHGLQSELNKLYDMFCARHPYFEASGGKASIVAHSLGSVIVYDIVTGWNPIQLYDQYVSQAIEETCTKVETASDLLSQLETARKQVSELESELLKLAEKQHLKTPTLKFKLENFFCLGSPLAVFLALRGVRPKGNGTQDHILPRSLCSRLFNVFHPSDPVAYRLEPLILKHYSSLMPLRIHRHDALERPMYDTMPGKAYPVSTSDGAAATIATDAGAACETSELVMRDLENLTDAMQKVGLSKEKNNNMEKKNGGSSASSSNDGSENKLAEMCDGELSSDSSSPRKVGATKSKSKNHILPTATYHAGTDHEDSGAEEPWINVSYQGGVEPTEMEYRLDYMLKEGRMENSYMAALTSHTAYWSNNDVALFMLMQLYPGNFTTVEKETS